MIVTVSVCSAVTATESSDSVVALLDMSVSWRGLGGPIRAARHAGPERANCISKESLVSNSRANDTRCRIIGVSSPGYPCRHASDDPDPTACLSDKIGRAHV